MNMLICDVLVAVAVITDFTNSLFTSVADSTQIAAKCPKMKSVHAKLTKLLFRFVKFMQTYDVFVAISVVAASSIFLVKGAFMQ